MIVKTGALRPNSEAPPRSGKTARGPRDYVISRSHVDTIHCHRVQILVARGDKRLSLSSSDAGAGLGRLCHSGCVGNAYDLFARFDRCGDHRRAFRSLHSEMMGLGA